MVVLADADEVLTHPLFVGVVVALITGGLTALSWMVVRAVNRFEQALKNHMGEEEKQRSTDLEAQAEFRTEVRAALRETRDDVRALHSRIDSALVGLATGTPEPRRRT